MSSQIGDTQAERPTYVRLTAAQRERLEELAGQGHRTLSGEIRRAIDEHIATHSAKADAS